MLGRKRQGTRHDKRDLIVAARRSNRTGSEWSGSDMRGSAGIGSVRNGFSRKGRERADIPPFLIFNQKTRTRIPNTYASLDRRISARRSPSRTMDTPRASSQEIPVMSSPQMMPIATPASHHRRPLSRSQIMSTLLRHRSQTAPPSQRHHTPAASLAARA